METERNVKRHRLVFDIDANYMTSKEAEEKNYYIGDHSNEDGFEIHYPFGFSTWLPCGEFEKLFVRLDTPDSILTYREVTALNEIKEIEQFEASDKYKNETGDILKTLLKMEKSVLSDYAYVMRYKHVEANPRNINLVNYRITHCSFNIAMECVKNGGSARFEEWPEGDFIYYDKELIYSRYPGDLIWDWKPGSNEIFCSPMSWQILTLK